MLRAIIVVLALGVARCGGAEIKDSNGWLVNVRQHQFLALMADTFDFPETPMGSSQAVAEVSVNGAHLDVLIVGPIQGEAKAYARAIDGWRGVSGYTGDVQYSQEDDCAAAEYTYNVGSVGKMEASMTVDAHSLVSAIKRAIPGCQIVLVNPKYSKLEGMRPPDKFSPDGTTEYWNITNGADEITTLLAAPRWLIGLMVAWLLLPAIGGLTAFGVGAAIAKNQAIPLTRRRNLYRKAVMGGIFATIGVHSVIVFSTIPTHALDPIGWLWFGTRFSSIAIVVMMPLFIGPLLIALPFMTRLEKKLLGPDGSVPAPAAMLPVPPKSKILLWSVAACLGVGFGLFLLLSNLPKANPLRDFAPFPMFLAIFGQLMLTRFSRKRTAKMIENQLDTGELQARLEQRVAAVSERMGVTKPRAVLSTDPLLSRSFNASAASGRVNASYALVKGMSDQELDFVIAHEMAHIRLRHGRWRKVALLVSLLPGFAIFVALPLLLSSPHFRLPPFAIPGVFLVAVLGPLAFVVLGTKRMRVEEFEADKLAMEATKDPVAAIDALTKLVTHSALPGIHDTDFASSHPRMAERIDAIKKLSPVSLS